jgi:hypothetical protein
MGKFAEARSKLIEAVVAEPYNRTSWVGITNWAHHFNLELNNIRLNDRGAVTRKDDKNINITLDSSLHADDPNGLAWTTYSLSRAVWNGDRFKKEFPNEPKYRRTLKEEVDSLTTMIHVLKEQKNTKKTMENLDPALRRLVDVYEAGLLEPFVLLNRADAEIALDYEAYRRSHRDTIRRYLDEIVVPQAP